MQKTTMVNGASGRGAERAVGERSGEAAGRVAATIPDPELVEQARRRQFTAEYKLRIVQQADACTQPGEVGALLRREGLYSSLLSAWRQQRDAGVAARALDGLWSEWFPVPGGAVRGRIFDLSGRFNLNALAAPDAVEAVRARQAFERVADSLALERTLVDAILALYAPGADARRLTLAHLSELDALPGMNPTRRRTLEAILTVLPDPAARLNLNRAAPETLAAWLDGLSLQQAEALIARGPWNELDAVLAQPELVGLPQQLLRQRLAVDSRWYLAQAQVVLDGERRDYFRLVGDGASGYDFRYISLGIP